MKDSILVTIRTLEFINKGKNWHLPYILILSLSILIPFALGMLFLGSLPDLSLITKYIVLLGFVLACFVIAVILIRRLVIYSVSTFCRTLSVRSVKSLTDMSIFSFQSKNFVIPAQISVSATQKTSTINLTEFVPLAVLEYCKTLALNYNYEKEDDS